MGKINNRKKYRTFRSNLVQCFVLSCVAGAFLLHAEKSFGDEVTWWVAVDPHVGRSGEATDLQNLPEAVADVNELGIADYAIILGDLVQDDYDFVVPFIRTMNQLECGWTYVLGNHDFHQGGQEPVLPAHFSARTVNGIRFVFISDEQQPGRHVHQIGMSDAQKAWLVEELETHREKPVFIFTHQQPHHQRGTFLMGLLERVEKYNVVAWFAGHDHSWAIEEESGLSAWESSWQPEEGKHYGFVHINPARAGTFGTFLKLSRTGNTVEATVTFRNHVEQEWISVDGKDKLTFSVDLERDRTLN